MAETAQGNARFAVNRTGSFEELLSEAKPVLQMGFGAVDAASPATRLARTSGRRREIGRGIGARARDQVVTPASNERANLAAAQ